MLVDKYGIRYKHYEQILAQGLTWQGMPILELAPGTASSMGTGLNKSPSRSGTRKPERTERSVPSAPPISTHTTFNMGRTGFVAEGVPIGPIHTPTHTMQHFVPRGDISASFPARISQDTRKVRPADFPKWVKKFNGSGDPYDHLASFKQVARAETVIDLYIKVECFGLTLEGKALLWFQTLNKA